MVSRQFSRFFSSRGHRLLAGLRWALPTTGTLLCASLLEKASPLEETRILYLPGSRTMQDAPTDSKKKRILERDNVLYWGKRAGDTPRIVSALKGKSLVRMDFSERLQLALDDNGKVYGKYKSGNWSELAFPCELVTGTVTDLAVCEHSMYLIDSKGSLVEIVYDFDEYRKHYGHSLKQKLAFEKSAFAAGISSLSSAATHDFSSEESEAESTESGSGHDNMDDDTSAANDLPVFYCTVYRQSDHESADAIEDGDNDGHDSSVDTICDGSEKESLPKCPSIESLAVTSLFKEQLADDSSASVSEVAVASVKTHAGLPQAESGLLTWISSNLGGSVAPNGVKTVRCTDDRVVVVLNNGRVFCRGNNAHGALGIGKNATFEAAENASKLLVDDIESHGSEDTTATTVEGQSEDWTVRYFVEIDPLHFDSGVQCVAVGTHHTLFVTENGRLFSCGADNFMQLGLGWTKQLCKRMDANWSQLGRLGYERTMHAFRIGVKDVSDYKEVPYFYEVPPHSEFLPRVVMGPYFDNYRVVAADAGDFHNAVIVEPLDFSAAFGDKLRRQLAQKRTEVMHRSAADNNNNNATGDRFQVFDEQSSAESFEASVLREAEQLAERRRVVTWGSSLKGQLGHCNFSNACEPYAVSTLEQIQEFSETQCRMMRPKPVAVACGKEHTLVLLDSHSLLSPSMVFAFGSNQFRQVSRKPVVKIPKPTWIKAVLPTEFKVGSVCAGNHQSAALI